MRSKKKGPYSPTGRPTGRPPMVTVNLTMQHNISGTIYGPGEVRVDENVAATLRGNEENVRRYKAYMSGAGAGIIIANPGGVALSPVDPAYFDAANFQADPRLSRIHVRG